MDAPPISAPLLKFFRKIVGGYFRRHFHAVRINGTSRFISDSGPLIVYANHSSWWDPMVSFLLASSLMPDRRHYAPMDAEALKRYKIFTRLGIFPIEMKTPRGAIQFLRTGAAVLKGGGVLWVTPQGRLADPRVRPLMLKPGLAALAARTCPCSLLPLAIEYPFWDERLPEALLQIGEPLRLLAGETEDAIQMKLTSALEATMEELKVRALTRDSREFTTLSQGTAGTGGVYGLSQTVMSLFKRRPYRFEHPVSSNVAHTHEGER